MPTILILILARGRMEWIMDWMDEQRPLQPPPMDDHAARWPLLGGQPEKENPSIQSNRIHDHPPIVLVVLFPTRTAIRALGLLSLFLFTYRIQFVIIQLILIKFIEKYSSNNSTLPESFLPIQYRSSPTLAGSSEEN